MTDTLPPLPDLREAAQAAHIALTCISTHPTLDMSDYLRGRVDAAAAGLEAALAAVPAQPDDRMRQQLRADLATESLAVDALLQAMGEDPEQYRTEGGAVNRPRLLAWLKDREAQPVQQPTIDAAGEKLP